MSDDFLYKKEFWSGDSRDGKFLGGEGFHYFKLTADGLVLEAFEVYDNDDGEEMISIVPEMIKVHWVKDLGFPDFDTLDDIDKNEFERVKEISSRR